jgi:hypothetical protein
MEGLFMILIIVVGLPLFLIIKGIVKLFNDDEKIRKAGLGFLLGGIALFGAFVLIGFSICSNMKFGGH